MQKKLMPIGKWRDKYFAEGCGPTNKTVRRWIDEGELPGERIGSQYYVDDARYQAKSGNELVDKVINAA